MNKDENLEDVAARLKREAEEIRAEAGDTTKKRTKAKAKKKAEPESTTVEVSESLVNMMSQAFHVAGTVTVDALLLAPPFSREQARVLAEAWVPVLEYYMGHSDNPLWDALIVTSIVAAPYAYQLYTRQEIEQGDDAQSEHIDRRATRRGENDVRPLPTV